MGVMDLFHLSGKVVLVTGAGSGLGERFAQAVAEAGATVACADIDVTSAHKTADHIRALGCQATAVDVDVAEEASVQRMVETTVHQFGALDVIFCNAGIGGGHSGRAHDLPLEVWHRVIAVNLTGVFLCVREAAKVMILRGRGGKMILRSSIYGQVGSHNGLSPAYTAAKGGVANLTRELATEYVLWQSDSTTPITVDRSGPVDYLDMVRLTVRPRGLRKQFEWPANRHRGHRWCCGPASPPSPSRRSGRTPRLRRGPVYC
jgi:NAD(P)-dependent dehydrogenase (short-subunit alcohol dehydrogenase family)